MKGKCFAASSCLSHSLPLCVCVCVGGRAWQMASECHKMLPYSQFFRFAATVGVQSRPLYPSNASLAVSTLCPWDEQMLPSPSLSPTLSLFRFIYTMEFSSFFLVYHFSVTPLPQPSFFINNHNSYLLMCSICF